MKHIVKLLNRTSKQKENGTKTKCWLESLHC